MSTQNTAKFRLVEVTAPDGLGLAHEIEMDGHTVALVYPDTGEDFAGRILKALNSAKS